MPVQPGDVIQRSDTGQKFGVIGAHIKPNLWLKLYVQVKSE